ncbi:MAG: archaeal heat shock protein Hsp20 [Candidatus Thermoplasmatota archaeon]
MDPFEDDDRKRKNPFDFMNDDDFERIFDEVQKIFESTNFKEMIEDMFKSNFDPNKRFIHGFSINIGPDGKPKIQEFGNIPVKTGGGKPMLSPEQEPLTDIIECDDDIAITVEVPGVDKDDIDLNVSEDTVEIDVRAPQRKYHKIVDLPSKVKPKSTKATYKNGVLDIVLEKKDKKKGGSGYKVSIE